MAKLKLTAELQDFLAKVNKIQFTEVVERNELKGDVFGTEATLEMRTKLNESGIMSMTHQTIFHVSIGGVWVETWGSDSDTSNTEMVKFFLEKKRDAQRMMDVKRDEKSEQMKAIFDAL